MDQDINTSKFVIKIREESFDNRGRSNYRFWEDEAIECNRTGDNPAVLEDVIGVEIPIRIRRMRILRDNVVFVFNR